MTVAPSGTEEHSLRELMPLHDRRWARWGLRREEVGLVRANDGKGGEWGGRQQTGDEPSIVRKHDVDGECEGAYRRRRRRWRSRASPSPNRRPRATSRPRRNTEAPPRARGTAREPSGPVRREWIQAP